MIEDSERLINAARKDKVLLEVFVNGVLYDARWVRATTNSRRKAHLTRAVNAASRYYNTDVVDIEARLGKGES